MIKSMVECYTLTVNKIQEEESVFAEKCNAHHDLLWKMKSAELIAEHTKINNKDFEALQILIEKGSKFIKEVETAVRNPTKFISL
jgi:hypothetical protein